MIVAIIIGIIVFVVFFIKLGSTIDAVGGLGKRIAELERKIQGMQGQGASNQQSTQPVQQVQTGINQSIPVPVKSAEVNANNEEWGGRALGIAGVLAVVLGVSFFLRYAFANNWIGETGRVMIGLFAGVILIGIGQYLREKYRGYSNIIMGCGIGVLYLTTFAAFAFYHLISSPVAYGLLLAVTALSVVLSVIDNEVELAMIGVIGGFLTPIFMTLSNAFIEQVLVYILILDLGVMIVSLTYHWRKLSAVAFAGTWILMVPVFARLYVVADRGTMCVFLSLYFVTFLASSVAHHVVRKESSNGADLGLVTINALSYAAIMYSLLHNVAEGFMGFFMLGLAIVYFLISYVSFESNKGDKILNMFLPAISALFLTLAIPAQFEGPWIALAWFAEAIILYAVDYFIRGKNLYAYGAIVFTVATIYTVGRYAANFVAPQNFVPVLNDRFFILAVLIVSCYVLAGIVYKAVKSMGDSEMGQSRSLIAVYFIVAQAATLFTVSTEIDQFYKSKIYSETAPIEKQISDSQKYYQNSGSPTQDNYAMQSESELHQKQINEKYNKISKINSSGQNEKNTVVDIFWILYASIIIGAGFAVNSKMFRMTGLVLMFISAFKIFVDIWALGALYRIVTSLVFGVIALIASFVYVKHKDKFKGQSSGGIGGGNVSGGTTTVAGSVNALIMVLILGGLLALSPQITVAQNEGSTEGRSIVESLKYRSEINSGSLVPGRPARIQLSPDIENLTDMDDIRIFTGISTQVPYRIFYSNESSRDQSVSLLAQNLSTRGGRIEFVMDTMDKAFTHHGLSFNPGELPVNFRYVVDIFASDNSISIDSGDWRRLSGQNGFANQYIFNFFDSQSGQSISNTKIVYKSSNSRYIKVVLTPLDVASNLSGDAGSQSSVSFKNDLATFQPNNVNVSGFSSGDNINSGFNDFTIDRPAKIVENSETKSTEIYAEVGANLGIFTNRVDLKTSSDNFYRHVVVQVMNPNYIDKYGLEATSDTNWQTVADGVIYSLNSGAGKIQNLTINYPSIKTQQIRVIVSNNDNQALSFDENVSLNSPAIAVAFVPSAVGPHYLYFDGNLSAPIYDIDKILSNNPNLSSRDISTVGLNGVRENPVYKASTGPIVPFSERYPWFLNTALVVLVLFIAWMIFVYAKKVAGTPSGGSVGGSGGVNLR